MGIKLLWLDKHEIITACSEVKKYANYFYLHYLGESSSTLLNPP